MQLQGRESEAIAVYREELARLEAVAASPEARGELSSTWRHGAERGVADARNELGWILATSPNAQFRNPSESVVCAERAVTATGRVNPMYLDTLAAAYAASGRFREAASVQREALALTQNEALRDEFYSRLKLFEAGKPYRNDGELAARANYLIAQQKFAEAEKILRECLTLREDRRFLGHSKIQPLFGERLHLINLSSFMVNDDINKQPQPTNPALNIEGSLLTSKPTLLGTPPHGMEQNFATAPPGQWPEFASVPSPEERCPISGLSRTTLIEHGEAGDFKLFRVRQKGKIRGKLLMHVPSLREWLHREMQAQTK